MLHLKKEGLLILLATTLTINLFSQGFNKNVDVSINKNFELFFAMHLCSNVDSLITHRLSSFPMLSQKDFDLKDAYVKKFITYKGAPQVQFYNEIASHGFLFGEPLNALLRVDSNMDIIDSCYFKQLHLPQEAKESIISFIRKLKEFSDLTGFDAFYNHNIQIYDSILNIHGKRIPLNEMVASIEDFFGWGLQGYHVILSPMMWPGGVSLGYSKNCEDNPKEIYVCVGPKSVNSGLPIFGTDDEFKATIIHEFTHPFIRYYCEKYIEQIEQYAALYKNDEVVYRRNVCSGWFSAINELLTRTVEIIITSGNDKEKAAQAVKMQSKELGFSLIPVLYQAFNKYYNLNEKEKKNLDAVFPEIIRALDGQ